MGRLSMRGIEARLARIEREQALRDGSGERQALQAWAAAGGPFSFVHGATDEEYETRVAVLRDTGTISAADKVARMPSLPPSGKTFLRALLWHDFDAQGRDRLRAALWAA